MNLIHDYESQLGQGPQGISFRLKIIFAVIVFAFAAGVFAMATGILQKEAPFLQQCNYTETSLRIENGIPDETFARSILNPYTNISRLNYIQYPLEYKCRFKQFYFETPNKNERYFVCSDGWLLVSIKTGCGYDYNLSILNDAPKYLSNSTI